MEKAFRVLQNPDEDKVRFVVYLLQDTMNDWWKSVDCTHGNDLELSTWEKFVKEFYCKYFSESKEREMENEFLNLWQDERTVEEYETEFNHLSKFVTAITLSEVRWTNKCEGGLWVGIRQNLTGQGISTYSEMVSRA